MIVVIFHLRIPRSFWNRRHRLLRDESFEHPVVLGQSSTYVSEFWLPSAIFIAKQCGTVCTFHSAQRKSGMAARGLGSYPIRGTAGAQALPDSKLPPSFAPHVRNCKQKPTLPYDFADFGALFANRRNGKISRCSRCRPSFRASFQQSRAARTNMRSMVKATTAQGTREFLSIAN